MTNQKNTPDKTESKGRPPKGIKQQIPDELVLAADKIKDRVTENFRKFVWKNGWTNSEAEVKLSPIITDASHMSKLLSGKRSVSLALLFVLHKHYGVDLNEFIAGDKSERPSLSPLQINTLREIVKMYDDNSAKSS